MKMDTFWVYIALKIDWIVKSLWCLHRFRTRKWMRVVKRSNPRTGEEEQAAGENA